MVSKWLERKIEDVILGITPIPYADEEVIQIAENKLGFEIPGLPPIDLEEMSTGHKILLFIFAAIPLLDVEYLDLVGLDPFKKYEKTGDGDLDLDPLAGDKTAAADGGGYRDSSGRYNVPGGNAASKAGKHAKKHGTSIGKIILIGGLAMVLLFSLFGVATASGYGPLAVDKAQYAVLGLDLEDEAAMVAEAGQTVKCFGNAACMRQWRMNNTERPGSEEVGESYKLQVEGFDVNNGYTLDVSGRPKDDTIPYTFTVYNPRHGLKGITAKNVQYRVKMLELGGGEGYCSTKWIPLGGEYVGEDSTGTIIPGGFARPLGDSKNMTLENCELLQPALGLTRKVELQLMYDYSSQSTLQFRAMSREQMNSLELQPSVKKSQTADTHVKTYVNVENPVTFREDGGDRSSSIFRVSVGVTADDREIGYKVHPTDFKLRDSTETVDVSQVSGAGSASCDGLENVGENEYRLSEQSREVINRKQEDRWFSKTSGPSPIGCSMVLENPESLSASGETLNMYVDANYTVLIRQDVTGFKAENSICAQGNNCPLLVPKSKAEQNEKLIAECSASKRVDAANGCQVRKGEDWEIVDNIMNPEVDKKVEQGETAYMWERVLERLDSNIPDTITVEEEIVSSNPAVGVEEEKIQQVEGGRAIVRYSDRNGHKDIEVKKVEPKLCRGLGGSMSQFMQAWNDKEGAKGETLYFRGERVNCQEEYQQAMEEVLGFETQSIRCGFDKLEDAAAFIDSINVAINPLRNNEYLSGEEEDTCQNILQEAGLACESGQVLVKKEEFLKDSPLTCYG